MKGQRSSHAGVGAMTMAAIVGYMVGQALGHGKAVTKPQDLRGDPVAPTRRQLSWTAMATLATFLTALSAGWAAWETRRGAEETSRATRANVWLHVLTEYAGDDMLVAMRSLRDWQRKDPELFASQYRNLLVRVDKTEGEELLVNGLDSHRRRLGNFYNKLRVLTVGGVVDEDVVSATWSKSTYRFVKDVLMPMELAKADALCEQGSTSEEEKQAEYATQEKLVEFYRVISERPKL